jgi:ferrous iron transport protein B
MVLVLNFLNALGTDGSFGQENSEKSVLSEIGRSLTPAFKPMGIRENNWAATVGIFTGVLAKEAVVGTLNALYSQQANSSTQAEPFVLKDKLLAAVQTIPNNLRAVAGRLLDPLGLSTATEEQAANTATFAAMQHSFDGKAGAFAYLLFILLYAPCVAATAAIYRETSRNWTVFVVLWTTGVAYMTATIFYQTLRFNQHQNSSLAWIFGLLLLFSSVLSILWWQGKKHDSV